VKKTGRTLSKSKVYLGASVVDFMVLSPYRYGPFHGIYVKEHITNKIYMQKKTVCCMQMKRIGEENECSVQIALCLYMSCMFIAFCKVIWRVFKILSARCLTQDSLAL
jgi:hypothetical protein